MEKKWLKVSDENGIKNRQSQVADIMWLIIALYEWTHHDSMMP